jgi:sugar phosphate permease
MTTSNNAMRQFDFNLNGSLNESKSLRFNFGGFLLRDLGLRNNLYPDEGGQIRGNIDYFLPDNQGKVRIYGGVIDLNIQNQIDIPYLSNDFSKPAPGWSPRDMFVPRSVFVGKPATLVNPDGSRYTFDQGESQKKRGLATGIFLVGSSVGNIIFPQLASRLVVMYDWRTAAVGVAIVAAILSFVPLIFIKNTPQEVGQNIDGEATLVSGHFSLENQPKVHVESSVLTIAELIKSPVFYLLLFVTAAFWFCGFGVLQNLRLYLTDCGFDIRQAANISSLFSVCSIIGKLSFGYLSDKFNKINTLIMATVGLILGVVCLKMVITNHSFAYLYAVFYGLGYSGAFAMIQLTVADLYKGASFKKVLGLVSSFDSIGGFAGVALLGYLRTQDGNYNSAMNLLLAVCGGALVLSLVLKRATVSG